MIDEDLQNAYKKAVYRIFKPEISWKVGEHSSELDQLLLQYDVEVATFVTACNPHSRLLPAQENAARNTELRQVLEKREYSYLDGQGEDPQGHWPAEVSYLVLDMDEVNARLLGRQFSQNAVLVITAGQAVRLLFCSD